ncbi:hypothetical protein [Candidatus Berkiella aquae]|uniref:Uncharacterized protein n=1 Tax=Candidatus Berkiella aquae TaxID=295108 RepID=A0A0Q9YXI4_9GAMM|nr:hypothetical protein [Candidatus Berkiella aquae]MCS5710606.1 hypothetical protein [Candidatus Berkiella aquae]
MLGFDRDKEQLLRLYNEIAKHKAIAQSKEKRLLVLVGESHHSLNSYYVELIIMIFAKELFSIKDLLLELDKTKIESFKRSKHVYENSNMGHGNMQSLFYMNDKEKFAHIIPIDLSSSENKFQNITLQGVRKRNEMMSKTANTMTKRDAVGIVGFNHLYGLLCETKLPECFHVVTINTSNHKNTERTPYGIKCEKFAFGNNAFQFFKQIPEDYSAKEVEEMAFADARDFISTLKDHSLEIGSDKVELLLFSLPILLDSCKIGNNIESSSHNNETTFSRTPLP